ITQLTPQQTDARQCVRTGKRDLQDRDPAVSQRHPYVEQLLCSMAAADDGDQAGNLDALGHRVSLRVHRAGTTERFVAAYGVAGQKTHLPRRCRVEEAPRVSLATRSSPESPRPWHVTLHDGPVADYVSVVTLRPTSAVRPHMVLRAGTALSGNNPLTASRNTLAAGPSSAPG